MTGWLKYPVPTVVNWYCGVEVATPIYPSVPSTLKYAAEVVAFRIIKSRAFAAGATIRTPTTRKEVTTPDTMRIDFLKLRVIVVMVLQNAPSNRGGFHFCSLLHVHALKFHYHEQELFDR